MLRLYTLPENTNKREFADSIALKLWDTTIERLPSGKPTLKGNNLNISISHTLNYWIIMDSEKACGVDIEDISRRSEHLASRFATLSEIELSSKVFSENPTLLIWCAKEALYKYFSREGVNLKSDFSIIFADVDRLVAKAFDEFITLKWYTENNLLIIYTL